ncbi:protein PAXX isoform 1-T1 [Liasis olivaceus]
MAPPGPLRVVSHGERRFLCFCEGGSDSPRLRLTDACEVWSCSVPLEKLDRQRNLAGPDAHPQPPRRQGHAAGPGRWAKRDLRPLQSLAPRGQEAAPGPHLRPGGAGADAGETPGRVRSGCCHLRGPQEPWEEDLAKPDLLGSRAEKPDSGIPVMLMSDPSKGKGDFLQGETVPGSGVCKCLMPPYGKTHLLGAPQLPLWMLQTAAKTGVL